MGAVFFYGVAQGRRAAEAPARTPLTLSGRPQGAAGGTATSGLPSLPPGLTLDVNGMIRGLDRRTAPGTVGVEWEALGAYSYTSERGLSDLPPDLKALDGKRVTLIGFAMPLY